MTNRLDPDHERCVDTWRPFRAKLVTTEGVLVETAHMLRRVAGGMEAALGILTSVKTTIVEPDERRYRAALRLMRRYQNVPMDFVDALLVMLADELSVDEVLTLDRRGFGVYRPQSGKRFRVLPE